MAFALPASHCESLYVPIPEGQGQVKDKVPNMEKSQNHMCQNPKIGSRNVKSQNTVSAREGRV